MSWQTVRGHDRWVRAFAQVMERGRLAHSYLFVGPAGVGKRLFAAELGKALLCEAPVAGPGGRQACDRCASCALVQGGTHPDFLNVSRPEEKNEFPVDTM